MGNCSSLESMSEKRESIQQALKNAARLSLCLYNLSTHNSEQALGKVCSAVSRVRCEDSPL